VVIVWHGADDVAVGIDKAAPIPTAKLEAREGTSAGVPSLCLALGDTLPLRTGKRRHGQAHRDTAPHALHHCRGATRHPTDALQSLGIGSGSLHGVDEGRALNERGAAGTTTTVGAGGCYRHVIQRTLNPCLSS
jgi:hypothetical protein